MTPRIRKHLRFTGMVQGVGFRYRARAAAQLYGATGWVKNCWDGSVEMEIQATEPVIDQVLLSIERGHFVAIDTIRARTLPLTEESDFVILDDD